MVLRAGPTIRGASHRARGGVPGPGHWSKWPGLCGSSLECGQCAEFKLPFGHQKGPRRGKSVFLLLTNRPWCPYC